jgi:hypothetical protein
MADLLAAATQESVGQDGRRRNRVVDSSDEDDQPQTVRSKRHRAAGDVENDEDDAEGEEEEQREGGGETLDDLQGWTIDTFSDKPVDHSLKTHRAVSCTAWQSGDHLV